MYNNDYRQTFIKSEINFDRSLAFIWFHFAYKNITYFTTFNISANIFDLPSWFNSSSEIYKSKISKIPKNKDIAFIYEINDKKIRANLYNTIDNNKYNISRFELNTSCENINGPVIKYYNNKQNYYIYYCFKNCSDEFYKNDSYCLNLDRKQRLNRIIIYIIIAVIATILFTFSIFLLIRFLRKKEEIKLANKSKQSKDEKLMNEILTDLLPSNN